MILLLMLLLGNPVEGRNCSADNGGCDHYCIDRNDGNDAICGCQCYYQLGPDLQSCNLIRPCDVDMLWMFDFSERVLSILNCARVTFNLADQNNTAFELWRNETAEYFQAFSTEIDNSDYHIATVVAGASTQVKFNYADLQNASALQNEIQAIPATATTICGKAYVLKDMYSIASGDNTITFNPSGARDGESTLRIAVVTMVSPLPSNDEFTLSTYASAIHSYFDQVFVIGKKDTSFTVPHIDEHLRWLACSNGTTTNCPYLFYTDGVNDNGATFSRPHVNPMIDSTACLSRRPTFSHSVDCGIGDVTITIPICILGGLTVTDLQLNDPSCNVSAKSETVGENLVITITYDECSWDLTYNTIDGYEHVTYSQTVTRGDTGVADTAKHIGLGATCQFLRYAEEDLGPLVPIQEAVTSKVIVNATFDVELLLYENSSYTSPYSTLPSAIRVTDRLYFSMKGNLPSGMKLILTDVVANAVADNSSPTRHEMLSDQCINDDTFQFENSLDDDEKRFQVQMFEFTSTVNLPNGQKDPVYLFATAVICEDTDSSTLCTQVCPSSGIGKRDTGEDSPNTKQIHRIGPFFLADSLSLPPNEDESVKPADQNGHPAVLTIELAKPPYTESGCLWILIILMATLIVIVTTKCLLGESQKKKAEIYEQDLKTPTGPKL